MRGQLECMKLPCPSLCHFVSLKLIFSILGSMQGASVASGKLNGKAVAWCWRTPLTRSPKGASQERGGSSSLMMSREIPTARVSRVNRSIQASVRNLKGAIALRQAEVGHGFSFSSGTGLSFSRTNRISSTCGNSDPS